MALTNDILAVLRAYADTVPEMVTAMSTGDDVTLRDLFNAESALYGWRTNVSSTEYRDAMTWSEVDGLQAGRARIWDWMTTGQSSNLDMSKASVRDGIANAFQGGTATNTRTALEALQSRLMTVAEEQLVLSDASTETQGDAKTMTFQGLLTEPEASQIRGFA